jgi:hypothetical protein
MTNATLDASPELAAARAELVAALYDKQRVDVRVALPGGNPDEAAAALERVRRADADLRDVEAREQLAAGQAELESRRQAAQPLLQRAAAELTDSQVELIDAATAAQTALLTLSQKAAAYEALRCLYARSVGEAGLRLVTPTDHGDGVGEGFLRVAGHGHVPCSARVVLRWLHARLVPDQHGLPPAVDVQTLSRASWTQQVPAPAGVVR